jgi:endonuclease/exonuclease/phosphatase family metal-dependent hydrolase
MVDPPRWKQGSFHHRARPSPRTDAVYRTDTVNGHYYWPVGAHSAQVRQVEQVLGRVKALDPGTSVIACGDFNATPGSRAITLMRQAFDSAHRVRHGREPDLTYPTPLISGGRARRMATRGLRRLFSIQPSDLWRGSLDYIFVSPEVRVVECDVFLDRPSPDDLTLYASDHFGLAATLEIPSHEGT